MQSTDEVPEHSVADRRSNWSGIVACVLTLVAISPMVVVVVTFAGDPVVPRSDLAIFDLRTRDVFSADPPLVGPFGDGWNHPGPISYLIPTVVGAPFGWPAWAIFVGGALVQATAIVWLAFGAWRHGGLTLLAVSLGALGLAYSVQGPWVATDPWNPHLAFPFFALFVFQLWSISEGSGWAWIGTAITASFLVQTHVGYAPLVVAGIAFAVVAAATRRASPPELNRALAIAATIAIVLWLPPLVEQVRQSPGNLSDLAGYFADSGESAIGFVRGAELMATELRLPPPWLTSERAGLDAVVTGASVTWLILPVVALIASAALVWYRRDARGARLVALAAVLLVTGVLALGRLSVETTWWRIMWRMPIAVFVVVVVGVVLTGAASPPFRDRLRSFGVVALAAAVPLGFGGMAIEVMSVDRGGSPMGQLLDGYDDVGGPVMVVELGRKGRHQAFPAIIDELDRAGVEVRVEPEEAYKFGAHRGVADPTRLLGFTEHGQIASFYATAAGGRVVARTTPLSGPVERELEALEVLAIAALERGDNLAALERLDLMDVDELLAQAPGLLPPDAERLVALSRKAYEAGCRCALIELNPDAPPPDVF